MWSELRYLIGARVVMSKCRVVSGKTGPIATVRLVVWWYLLQQSGFGLEPHPELTREFGTVANTTFTLKNIWDEPLEPVYNVTKEVFKLQIEPLQSSRGNIPIFSGHSMLHTDWNGISNIIKSCLYDSKMGIEPMILPKWEWSKLILQFYQRLLAFCRISCWIGYHYIGWGLTM